MFGVKFGTVAKQTVKTNKIGLTKMDIYIVADIHNNSLVMTHAAKTVEEALELSKNMAQTKLGRELTEEEESSLADSYEIFAEDDPDNIWCITVGMVRI